MPLAILRAAGSLVDEQSPVPRRRVTLVVKTVGWLVHAHRGQLLIGWLSPVLLLQRRRRSALVIPVFQIFVVAALELDPGGRTLPAFRSRWYHFLLHQLAIGASSPLLGTGGRLQ